MKVRYERTAFYYETDQMAIIHHANYIRWLEEARIFAMQQVGIDYAAMEKKGVQIPVLGVECTYRSMVRFGDTVNIDAWVEEYDGVRLVIGYTITDKKTAIAFHRPQPALLFGGGQWAPDFAQAPAARYARALSPVPGTGTGRRLNRDG